MTDIVGITPVAWIRSDPLGSVVKVQQHYPEDGWPYRALYSEEALETLKWQWQREALIGALTRMQIKSAGAWPCEELSRMIRELKPAHS